MKRIGIGLLLVAGLAGCLAKKESLNLLKTGEWRAIIRIQGQDLPFNLEVVKDRADAYRMYLRNDEEKILLDEITVAGDSVDIVLHLFDANIKALISGDTLRGEFILNYAANYRVPFLAFHGQSYRFESRATGKNTPRYSGKYAVQFIHEQDTTPAIGIFRQENDKLTGTFLTPTGDYRFLEGNVSAEGRLQLSTFDGNHAYLFNAVAQSDGNLSGDFYSGKTMHATWTAQKNESATLPDADKLTYLRAGYDRVAFSFPDINENIVSLTDGQFRDKVVILQLFGTWCPNCLDETQFLTAWYDNNKDRGIEIIGLAYERKDDFTYARNRIKKMINKLDIHYPIVVAGTDDKEAASKTLPMLNKVVAFPTTIFIGRDGKVKKIHTGFSGPGTGSYYDMYMQQFNETVNELVKGEDIHM